VHNHNGGGLAFGPNDGFLYIASGDGGGAGDPQCNGQNLNTLLGKLLRIDVDSAPSPGLAYKIPPSNPFVGQAGKHGEVWAYGLRNPFRFSFDRMDGRLFIGDVGKQVRGSGPSHNPGHTGGLNFGWNIMEGNQPFSNACTQVGSLTAPIFTYDHLQGDEAVIGGYVYHGGNIPALRGAYVFGDFISGRIWTLTQDAQGTWTRTQYLSVGGNSTASFGQDQAGDLYVTNLSTGTVSRIRQVGGP
jgi:glucose/arabinose dehydrogenase